METARVAIEVLAGLIPGKPEPEFTKQWVITSNQWHAADGAQQRQLMADRIAEAGAYAASMMLRPERFNWVRTDWIWF